MEKNNSDQRPTILVVDDHPDTITLISYVLKDRYRIRAANSGEAALHVARLDNRTDLILLDVMMPEIDGFKVCGDLKANPATRDIPIIFLTSLVHRDDKKLGLELGAVDYINKPIDPEELLACVRKYLPRKWS